MALLKKEDTLFKEIDSFLQTLKVLWSNELGIALPVREQVKNLPPLSFTSECKQHTKKLWYVKPQAR